MSILSELFGLEQSECERPAKQQFRFIWPLWLIIAGSYTIMCLLSYEYLAVWLSCEVNWQFCQ